MNDNEKEIMKEKINYYKSNESKIHITLTNGNWLNGRILEVKEDKIILLEDKFGTMLVLFLEIKDIVPMVEDGGRE